MDSSIASIAVPEEEEGQQVKPYKIHVSSKYLTLTRKKLELTRLPHEILLPADREWENGTPKSEIEPLIDFWLEQYDWRDREMHLNSSYPQHRTAIAVPGMPTPLRIHFLHIRSSHAQAIPLLLIPSFPLTNLSLAPLFESLTSPPSPSTTQPFHLVVPSLPGLGFSDAFNVPREDMLASTALILNTLMGRLGYEYYLASSTGSGRESPAEIDYHLARLVVENFSDNCLGVHIIAPPLRKPELRREPWSWTKFKVAEFFHAPIFGYQAEDFSALVKAQAAAKAAGVKKSQRAASTRYKAVAHLGLREPNTFSYALCDSPVGLLSLVCSALRRRNPRHTLSETEIIDVTQLSWLPGPEAAARFWAGAVKEVESFEAQEKEKPRKRAKTKGRVAMTVFGSDGVEEEGYVCPAWGKGQFDIVFAQRKEGRAGLVAWERAEAVVDGIRGLADEVEKVDRRLKIRALERVVFGEQAIEEQEEGGGLQLDAETPDTIVPAPL